mgnify:CR=1 FL=1
MDKILKEIYYNPETGLVGAHALYTKAKSIDPKITKTQVTQWLKQQETNQIHFNKPLIKHFFPIKSNYKDHIWQCDLMDVSNQAHKNSGVNFLLCVIDIYTRYAWVIALKNKTNTVCTAALQKILAESGRKPEILMSDNGSEFISRSWKALLKTNNIEPSYAEPGDHHRQGIIERFNKTLRTRIENYKTAYKTERWIDVLDKLVYNYNHTVHSSIGSAPVNADDKKIQQMIEKKEEAARAYLSEFKEGDQVRFVKNKVLFEKGAAPNWTSTVYTVKKTQGKRYELDNGKTYLYYQLQPITKVDTWEPPEQPKIVENIEPKKVRRALKKEGVEKTNITRTLRSRKPQNLLTTKKGERIIWS